MKQIDIINVETIYEAARKASAGGLSLQQIVEGPSGVIMVLQIEKSKEEKV